MGEQLVDTEVNAQRVAAVESCFGPSGHPLATPGRVLVGEGVLTKMCRKKPKARIFFLFSDLLVYGTVLVYKRRYTGQHLLPLDTVTVEDLPDNDCQSNRWMIKTPQKSFVVCAATAPEKADWLQHIADCVRCLLQRAGKEPCNEHAAPWVQDSVTDICMRCTNTRFSALVRRHHCRHCGFVVCRSCSRQRLLLPSLSAKPLRVCTLCYGRLAAEANTGQAGTGGTGTGEWGLGVLGLGVQE
ncbi:pleckstrin homology domain-containing family F member 1 [Rhinoraja longicauda]